MRKTILRRLETLEKEEQSRQQTEKSALGGALVYIWRIVLGYYVGGLETANDSPDEAHARALKYTSHDDFREALFRKDPLEIRQRHNDACRQLFTACELDFDRSPTSELFEAFVGLIERLPDEWSGWLRSQLQAHCKDVKIADGSNVPRQLSCDNFNLFSNDVEVL
jgi:hypothetical protein